MLRVPIVICRSNLLYKYVQYIPFHFTYNDGTVLS